MKKMEKITMKKKKKITMKKMSTALFNSLLTVIFTCICFSILYPFIYALSYSLSDGIEAQKHPVFFLPAGFSLQNYQAIFSDDRIFKGFMVSVSRTIFGILFCLIVTGLCAYAMSKPKLKFKKALYIFYVIPMYFSGGIIPIFLNIRDLGLMNSFFVYIIPSAFVAFYMFIMRSYFNSIPFSLDEAARLDGAGELAILYKIYLPLAKPVIATVGLYAGVFQWNSWFDAMLYITNQNLFPLQMILQKILQQSQQISSAKLFLAGLESAERTLTAETYTMAMLIVTTLPIVFIYPFTQKYFIKGMTIGAVKL